MTAMLSLAHAGIKELSIQQKQSLGL